MIEVNGRMFRMRDVETAVAKALHGDHGGNPNSACLLCRMDAKVVVTTLDLTFGDSVAAAH